VLSAFALLGLLILRPLSDRALPGSEAQAKATAS